MQTLEDKLETLRGQLAQLPSLVVAYSGGVDSAYLLSAATEALGKNCHGVLADSPSLARHELAEALELANRRGWMVRTIATHELDDPRYAANPLNRCYYCKHELFEQLGRYAKEHGIARIAYGENADDAHDFRPGQQAAREYEIIAPLRDAGLAKADVRELSRRAGLPTASKAAQPCLSSRLQPGHPVTRESLAQVEAGEDLLRDAGFHIFRLRHQGVRAKVQVAPGELPRLEQPQLRRTLTEKLLALGFAQIEFDPEGYQGASLR